MFGRLDQSEAAMWEILKRKVAPAPAEAGKLTSYFLQEAYGFNFSEGFRLTFRGHGCLTFVGHEYRWSIISGVAACQNLGSYLEELVEDRMLIHFDRDIRERLIARTFEIIEAVAMVPDDDVDEDQD